jgi:hypothetical protein
VVKSDGMGSKRRDAASDVDGLRGRCCSRLGPRQSIPQGAQTQNLLVNAGMAAAMPAFSIPRGNDSTEDVYYLWVLSCFCSLWAGLLVVGDSALSKTEGHLSVHAPHDSWKIRWHKLNFESFYYLFRG